MRCSFNDAQIIVEGDFNCRVGNFNHFSAPSRISMDLIVNGREKILVGCMDKNEFFLCNGRSLSDSPAQFTYIGGNVCRVRPFFVILRYWSGELFSNICQLRYV